MRTALDEPMREMRETADAIKQAANIEGLDELVSDAKKGFRFDSAAPAPTHAKVREPAGAETAATDASDATDATTTAAGGSAAAPATSTADDEALVAALDADPGTDLVSERPGNEEQAE